jgi:hypothetical protein
MFALEDFAESILKGQSFVQELEQVRDQDLYQLVSDLTITDTQLVVVMEELLMNAREHGASPIRIFAGKRFGKFYFSVWDLGNGIHSTIPNNKFLSDTRDKSASAVIRLACEEGITGTGILGRGVGLHLMSSFCKERREECLLLSDGGFVLQMGDQFFEKAHPPIQGTLVCLRCAL